MRLSATRHQHPATGTTALVASVAGLLSCASCTDLLLSRYRDDRLIADHRYALGERVIEVDGLKLCYQEFGAGEPLLIVPGLGTSIDFWQFNIPALAREYRVLAVDPPGFGKSDKPHVAYELSWISEKIFAFLDARGIPRAHVMGGSMGGHLAVLMALARPERVDKVIVIGCSAFWETPGPLAELSIRWFWNERLVADHFRRCWPDVYPRLFTSQTPATREWFRYQMACRANGRHFAPEGWACASAMRSILLSSCLDRLPTLQQPTLIVWGEEDAIHPLRDAVRARALIPDSRLVVFGGAQHEVMIDHADAFNRLTLTFLKHGTAAIEDDFDGTPAPAPDPPP